MPNDKTESLAATPSDFGKPPLKKNFLLAYGSGQCLEALMGGVIPIFILFYLTTACGLRPDLAGLILLISLVVDAVADPLIGALSDGWKSKWGRRHPFMLVGLFALAVSILGVFIVPKGIPTEWLFAYLLVFNILMRISFSIFILPYGALVAELSSDYRERARVMSYRLGFAICMIGTSLWLGFDYFFDGEDALSQSSSYVPFAILLAGIVVVTGLTSTFGTLSIAKQNIHPPEQQSPMSRIVVELLQLFRNPSFLSMFLGILIIMTAMLFVNSLNLHVFRYYWHLTSDQIQLSTVAQPIGMLVSLPLSMWLVKVVEKRTIVFIEIGALSIAFGLPALLSIFGILPTEGLASLLFVILSGTVFGMCMGLGFVAFGSMIADTSDEHDFLYGVRREGLCFAALVFAGKTATGLGGMLAGASLQLIGFPTDPTSPEGAAQLTPEVIGWLGVLWGPAFAVCCLLSVPFFLKYKLDRQKHAAIIAAIGIRNAERC